MRRSMTPSWILTLALASSAAAGQSRDPGAPTDRRSIASPAYGTLDSSVYNVAADDMKARLSEWDMLELINGGAWSLLEDTDIELSGPIHLPSGVVLESAEVFYFDTITFSNPEGMIAATTATGAVSSIGDIQFPNTSAGNASITLTFPPNTVVDNETNTYSVQIYLQNAGSSGEHGYYRTRIRYRRQVSPDPAFSTFNDVLVGHPFHRYVEALAASGVTAGCSASPPLFCPGAPLTRGQMAVFLAIALGLHFPN
jgi:hypothetical protein